MARTGLSYDDSPSCFNAQYFAEMSGLRAAVWTTRFRLIREDTELFFRLSIGGKICAVSGVGCVQTDDDVSNVRLTIAVNPDEATYWKESIVLLRSLLRNSPSLSPKYRRIAQFRLASLLLATYSPGLGIGKSGEERMELAQPRMGCPFFRNIISRT